MVGSFTFEIKPNRKQLIIEKILELDAQPIARIDALYTLNRNRILRRRALARALEAIPSINITSDNDQFAIYLKRYSIDTLISYANSLYEQNGLKPLCWKYETKRDKVERLHQERETRIRIDKLTQIIEPKHFYNNLWRPYCRHSERKEYHQINHELTPQNEKEIVCKIDYTENEIIKYLQNIEKNLPNYELYTRIKQIPAEVVGLIYDYLEDPEEMIIKSIMESFEVMHIHIENESHRKRFINWILHEYIPKYSTLPVNISKIGQLIIKL